MQFQIDFQRKKQTKFIDLPKPNHHNDLLNIMIKDFADKFFSGAMNIILA